MRLWFWVDIPRYRISRKGNEECSLPYDSDYRYFICLISKQKTPVTFYDWLCDFFFNYLDFTNEYFQRLGILNSSICCILPLEEWEENCVCYIFFLWSIKTSSVKVKQYNSPLRVTLKGKQIFDYLMHVARVK